MSAKDGRKKKRDTKVAIRIFYTSSEKEKWRRIKCLI